MDYHFGTEGVQHNVSRVPRFQTWQGVLPLVLALNPIDAYISNRSSLRTNLKFIQLSILFSVSTPIQTHLTVVLSSCRLTTVHPNLCDVTLFNVTLSLISRNPQGTDVHNLNLFPCCHIFLPYMMSLTLKQSIKAFNPHLHASCCHHYHYYHHCNVDQVLFPNIIYCTYALLSCIHVNTTCLLNITCTLVATCLIFERLECSVTYPI